ALTMSFVTLTVVLVDDDARYRRVARLALESEGVSVLAEAGDGCEAVRVLEDSRADVVLLDIGLPGMSGSEVARRLRGVGGGPVVILISSRGADYGHRVAEGIAAGFIAKDVLCLAAIERLLVDSM
ncbi:MAG: hypothetical protein QOJ89_2450, partial [bacterium]